MRAMQLLDELTDLYENQRSSSATSPEHPIMTTLRSLDPHIYASQLLQQSSNLQHVYFEVVGQQGTCHACKVTQGDEEGEERALEKMDKEESSRVRKAMYFSRRCMGLTCRFNW